LLQIELVREIPEALKARKIDIGSGSAGFIQRDEQSVASVASTATPQPASHTLTTEAASIAD